MMKRTISKHGGLLAALFAIVAVAAQFGWVSATTATGPVPATTNTVTLTASPVTSLTDGSDVTYNVVTSGSTKLVGNITAHLCQHGFTSYTSAQFGYDDPGASRCVYSPGIVSGGLTGADYESTSGPYSGSVSQPPVPLHFKAGTGSLVWGNNAGYGPFTITCDSAHPCDLVLQVNLVGDSVAQTYFIQPLNYTGAAVTTTTTSSTTTSSTTTSSTTSTSTTSTSSTTTTTKPATTTTTPATTTTVNPNGSVDPSTVAPGGVITVTSTGWKPSGQVALTLHSTPVALGTLTADANGKVSGQFTLPADTAVGSHTVELTGTDPQSTARTVDLTVTVATATPATTIAVAAGSGGTTPTGASTATGLAFTGGPARSLTSAALLMIALGLFLLGQYHRRRTPEAP